VGEGARRCFYDASRSIALPEAAALPVVASKIRPVGFRDLGNSRITFESEVVIRVRSLTLNVGSLRCRNLSGVGGRPDASWPSRKTALMTTGDIAARKERAGVRLAGMGGPHARGVIRSFAEAPATEEQMAISMRAMRKHLNVSTADGGLCAWLARTGLVAMLAIGGSNVTLSQTRSGGDARPAVGGIASLPDAALIYLAQGAPGACGDNCSNWLAAEGTIHWDGHTRFTAALDRFADRKRPIFLNVRGQSDLNAAMSIGRLLRERGYDVGIGQTIADQCRGLNDSDCVALKRSGVSLPASLSSIGTCDVACVLILAGGVRRTLPEDTTILIQSTKIANRLGLNVSDEHRDGVHAHFHEQSKLYFAQMGVDPVLADMIDANFGTARSTRLLRADVVRLRIVTGR
jgi:hypothetical protein